MTKYIELNDLNELSFSDVQKDIIFTVDAGSDILNDHDTLFSNDECHEFKKVIDEQIRNICKANTFTTNKKIHVLFERCTSDTKPPYEYQVHLLYLYTKKNESLKIYEETVLPEIIYKSKTANEIINSPFAELFN